MALIAKKSRESVPEQLRRFVAANLEALEPGLKVLETALCLGRSTVDVVAVDHKQTLVLVAVAAQILRNWLLLHAAGVDASLLDATAVLIAGVILGMLPVGPAAGTAAAVLILGRDGVAAAAAAGVLLTVTGTVGGLLFAAWSGLDRLTPGGRRSRLTRTGHGEA